MTRKCLDCNGCLSDNYIEAEGAVRIVYYCDFCDKYFKLMAGGKLEVLTTAEMRIYGVEFKRRKFVRPAKPVQISEERK